MSRTIRIALAVAAFLMVAGIIITIISVASTGFNVNEISDGDYVERTFTVEDGFEGIDIDVSSEDVSFYLTDGTPKVVSYQRDDVDVDVRVSGNVLKVETSVRNWFSMGINFQNPTIKVYLNKTSYSGNLKIKTSSGNVEVPASLAFANASLDASSGNVALEANVTGNVYADASSGNILIDGVKAETLEAGTSSGNIVLTSCGFNGKAEMSCSSGDITVRDSEFAVLSTKTTSGDLKMNGVNVSDSLKCESSSGEMGFANSFARSLRANSTSGDLSFDRFDSRSINIETTSGEVEGTFLTDKLFNVRTNSGDIDVPSPRGEDECNISTTSGDVELKIA